jgi:hypothetical protein
MKHCRTVHELSRIVCRGLEVLQDHSSLWYEYHDLDTGIAIRWPEDCRWKRPGGISWFVVRWQPGSVRDSLVMCKTLGGHLKSGQ